MPSTDDIFQTPSLPHNGKATIDFHADTLYGVYTMHAFLVRWRPFEALGRWFIHGGFLLFYHTIGPLTW